jgi:hypothetical protein
VSIHSDNGSNQAKITDALHEELRIFIIFATRILHKLERKVYPEAEETVAMIYTEISTGWEPSRKKQLSIEHDQL